MIKTKIVYSKINNVHVFRMKKKNLIYYTKIIFINVLLKKKMPKLPSGKN